MKRIKSTLRTCFKTSVRQALQPVVRPLKVVLFALAGLSIVIPFASQTVRAQVDEEEAPVAVDETPTERLNSEQSAPRETLSEAELTRFQVDVKESLWLRIITVQQLNVGETAQAEELALILGGQERVLELYPYSMRSDDFVLFVQDETGVLNEHEPPSITTYRGMVRGDNQSQVTASIVAGQLHAIIQTATDAWAVQPVSQAIAGAPADLHAVFRVSDVIPTEGVCGVDDALVPRAIAPAKPNNGTSEALENLTTAALVEGFPGRTRIAFDADVEFFQANSSSVTLALADIEMIMNLVGVIYQNQLNICYVITGIIVRTVEPDPYVSPTNSSLLLAQFKGEWDANVSFSRDVAHLMTHKTLELTGTGGRVIGLAYTGTVCTGVHYGLLRSRFQTNLAARTGLTAHELGHNWNACHCDNGGCTVPGCCTGSLTADGDCGIMWSGAGTQQSSGVFGTRSGGAITGYRAFMSTYPYLCFDTCANVTLVDGVNCGNEMFFCSVLEGIRHVQVGGTVIISATTPYPETMTINKAVTLLAVGGTVTIGP